MEKKEFKEMLVLNQALGGKYDALLEQIANGLGFDTKQFIGFANFKEQLKLLLEGWIDQTVEICRSSGFTTKYEMCHVDISEVKERVTSKCNSKWKYIQALGERLNNAISDGMTLGEIRDKWKEVLIKLKNEIDIEVLKNSATGGKGQRWKLTKSEMETIKDDIKLIRVVDKKMLYKIDVAFVEEYPDFKEMMEAWGAEQKKELDDSTDKKGNYKVTQSALIKNKDKITCSASAFALKNQIITNVESYVKETPVPLSKVIEIVKDSLVSINKPDFLRALFFNLKTNGQEITKFEPPTKIVAWLGEFAVEKLPKEIYFEYYKQGIKTWIGNVKDAINVFYTGLEKPEDYSLDTSKFAKHLMVLFGTEYGKKKAKLGTFIYTIIKQFLDKAAEGKIKLGDFDKVWQESILLNELPLSVLFEEFNLIYEDLTEEEWVNVNLPLILPQKSELIYACKESSYDEPKSSKKKPEIVIPHPTPKPELRKNALIVFGGLGVTQFYLSIIDLDTNKAIEGATIEGTDRYTFTEGLFRSGKKYQFILERKDKTIEAEKEVEIINGQEDVNILFLYEEAEVRQKILSYVVPFMPIMVEVYSGSGEKLQTITSFKTANDFSFECLSMSDLKGRSPYTSGAMDFSFKFIGATSKSDYWFSTKEYKTNYTSVSVGFKVEPNIHTVFVDFPYEPWDAFISASQSATDKTNKSLVVIKGKEDFLIGKGIEGNAPAYLHVRSKDKKVVIKKVDKAFSEDQWRVLLNLSESNSIIDYGELETILSIRLNEWVVDVSYILLNKLNVKIDKVANSDDVSTSSSVIEVLKSLASGLGELGGKGTAAAIAIQIILVIVNDAINAPNWGKGLDKSKMISLFKKDVVDKIKKEISSNYTTIITKIINDNPGIRTTEDCKKILMEDINQFLPKPKDLIEKIDWN